MNKIDKKYSKIFEEIKYVDENGIEFWYVRELKLVLGYREWKKLRML